MATRLFTWTAASALTPVAAADTESDTIALGTPLNGMGWPALPGQGLCYVGFRLVLGGAAGTWTLVLSLRVTYRGGPGTGDMLCDDTGAVRTWSVVYPAGGDAIGATHRLIQFSLPNIPSSASATGGAPLPGPQNFSLLARGSGAGIADSSLTARLLFPNSQSANT